MVAQIDLEAELIGAAHLDRELDRDRVELMLNLVDRVRRRRAQLVAYATNTLTATEKKKQLRKAVAALIEVEKQCGIVENANHVLTAGGPRGSPDVARMPLVVRMQQLIAFPTLPSGRVRVWRANGRPSHATHGDDDLATLKRRDATAVVEAGPIRDTAEVMRGLEDLVYVWPELLVGIVGSIRSAAAQVLAEVEAAGQTLKSEASRDDVVRDLAMVFHALHRWPGTEGVKTGRIRFVFEVLRSCGDAIGKASVANRLRASVFRFGQSVGPLPEIPPPNELDAARMLAALKLGPGRQRADALAPLAALLGPASGIVLLDLP